MIVLSRANMTTAGSKKRISFNKKSLVKRIVDYRYIYLLGLPGLIVLFLFQYMPLSGILMAFQNYNPHLGLTGSEWVGLKHFKVLFADPKFYSMLRNTLTISGLNLLTFPAPIILALMLNEVRRAQFKKFIQTSVYLPHFLSWAIVASLTFFLLSREQGLVNKLAISMGNQPMAYLFSPKWIYPIIIFQQVWRGIGWGSIVYLAAIAGIEPSLYEAATIDGANKLQTILRITLPSIMPTIAVMLILKMGSIISVDFEQVFLMSNALVKSKLEVFEIYIYNNGIASGSTQYSYTTAIGLFKSVVSTTLVLTTNYITTRKGFEGIV